MSNLELVRKAARGKDVHRIGCFASNRSAEKLEERGERVLPDIELFLSAINLSEHEASASLLGLTNVLVTYFKLAAESEAVDCGAFLLSLHGWLREEATRVVFLNWGPSHNSRFERLVPERLRWAIDRLARSGSEKERDFAERLSEHQAKVMPKKKLMARAK